jgi:hypothetical protein
MIVVEMCVVTHIKNLSANCTLVVLLNDGLLEVVVSALSIQAVPESGLILLRVGCCPIPAPLPLSLYVSGIKSAFSAVSEFAFLCLFEVPKP